MYRKTKHVALGCKKADLLDDSREKWMAALSAVGLGVRRVLKKVACLVVSLAEKKVDSVGKMAVLRVVLLGETQAALKVCEMASRSEMKWAGLMVAVWAG